MFEFEKIVDYQYQGFSVFREVTTDCLFVRSREGCISGKYTGGLTQMLDPSNGKPLTYTNWQEKYAKNVK